MLHSLNKHCFREVFAYLLLKLYLFESYIWIIIIEITGCVVSDTLTQHKHVTSNTNIYFNAK